MDISSIMYCLCFYCFVLFLTKTFILRFHQKIDPNLSTEQLACVSTLNGYLSFVFRHLNVNLSSFSPLIHLPLLPSILLSPIVPWSCYTNHRCQFSFTCLSKSPSSVNSASYIFLISPAFNLYS